MYIGNQTTESYAFPNGKSSDAGDGIIKMLNTFHFQIQLYFHFDMKVF